MFDGSGRGSASLASSPGGPCAVTSGGGPGLRCSPLPQRPRPRSSRGRHPLSEAGAVAWSRRPGTRQPGCVCCANSRRPPPQGTGLPPTTSPQLRQALADVVTQRQKWTEASTETEGVTALLFTGVISVDPQTQENRPKITVERECGRRWARVDVRTARRPSPDVIVVRNLVNDRKVKTQDEN